MMKNYDQLIVGQGIAGTLLVYELQKAGRNVLVIDRPAVSASRVAAGMFTPISGKRMVKHQQADEWIKRSRQTYTQLEEELGISFFHPMNIYQAFGSVKEQNDLSLREEDRNFSKHIQKGSAPAGLHAPFGGFETTDSGWADLPALLQAFSAKLEGEGCLLKEEFQYDDLKFENGSWQYKGALCSQVVFCEGSANRTNPWFGHLPFVWCKGEVLTIRCKGLPSDRILKKGIYLVPLGDALFKAGSTYEWNDLSNLPSQKGRDFLQTKLDDLLQLPYEIIAHEAAIRPTTRDRSPMLGEHPQHKNMFIFNGLGTKGVLIGPYYAAAMAGFLLSKVPLPGEGDIGRF